QRHFMPRLCRQRIPGKGASGIAVNAKALLIKHGEIVARGGYATDGGGMKPEGRLLVILRGALAIEIHKRRIDLRGHKAAPSRAFEEIECAGGIRLCAAPFF